MSFEVLFKDEAKLPIYSTDDRSPGVPFETKDFKVTAVCAYGSTESSHLEMFENHLKLLLPDADYTLAEIIAEVEQILLEGESLIDQMQGQERSAGNSVHVILKASGPSSDVDEGDQCEICFFVSLPPGAIRSSRKKLKRGKRQSKARKNLKTAEVEGEILMLEHGKNQAEEDPTLILTPVTIMAFAIFVFVIFFRVFSGG